MATSATMNWRWATGVLLSLVVAGTSFFLTALYGQIANISEKVSSMDKRLAVIEERTKAL